MTKTWTLDINPRGSVPRGLLPTRGAVDRTDSSRVEGDTDAVVPAGEDEERRIGARSDGLEGCDVGEVRLELAGERTSHPTPVIIYNNSISDYISKSTPSRIIFPAQRCS